MGNTHCHKAPSENKLVLNDRLSTISEGNENELTDTGNENDLAEREDIGAEHTACVHSNGVGDDRCEDTYKEMSEYLDSLMSAYLEIPDVENSGDGSRERSEQHFREDISVEPSGCKDTNSVKRSEFYEMSQYLHSWRSAESIIPDIKNFRERTGLHLPNGDLRAMKVEESPREEATMATHFEKVLHCCKRQSRESVIVAPSADNVLSQTTVLHCCERQSRESVIVVPSTEDDDLSQAAVLSSGQSAGGVVSEEQINGCCASALSPPGASPTEMSSTHPHYVVQEFQRQHDARIRLAVEELTRLESRRRQDSREFQRETDAQLTLAVDELTRQEFRRRQDERETQKQIDAQLRLAVEKLSGLESQRRNDEARLRSAVEGFIPLESKRRAELEIANASRTFQAVSETMTGLQDGLSNVKGKTFQSVREVMMGLQEELFPVDCDVGDSQEESPELYARLKANPSSNIGFTAEVGSHLPIEEPGFASEKDRPVREDFVQKLLDGSWEELGGQCCSLERVETGRMTRTNGTLLRMSSTSSKLSRSSTASTIPQYANAASSSKLTLVATPQASADDGAAKDGGSGKLQRKGTPEASTDALETDDVFIRKATPKPEASTDGEETDDIFMRKATPKANAALKQDSPDLEGNSASNGDSPSAERSQSQTSVVSGLLAQLKKQNSRQMAAPAGQVPVSANDDSKSDTRSGRSVMDSAGTAQPKLAQATRRKPSFTKSNTRGDGKSVLSNANGQTSAVGNLLSGIVAKHEVPSAGAADEGKSSGTFELPSRSTPTAKKPSASKPDKESPSVISKASNVINVLGPFAQRLPKSKSK